MAAAFVPLEQVDSQAAENMPSSRSGTSTAVWREYIVYYGGMVSSGDEEENSNDVILFSTKTRDWGKLQTTGTPPPPSYGGQIAVLSDDKTLLVHCGVSNTEMPVPTIHHLDLETGHWTTCSMRIAVQQTRQQFIGPMRWGHRFVRVPRFWIDSWFEASNFNVLDAFFVIGGEAGTVANDVLLFWRSADNALDWKCQILHDGYGDDVPRPRRRHVVGLFQDEFIFVFGGRTKRKFYNDLWIYCIGARQWVPVKAATSPAILKMLFDHGTVGLRAGDKLRGNVAIQRACIAALQKGDGKQPKVWPEPRTGLVGGMVGSCFWIGMGYQYKADKITQYNDIWLFDTVTAQWWSASPNTDFVPDGEGRPQRLLPHEPRARLDRFHTPPSKSLEEHGWRGPRRSTMACAEPIPGEESNTILIFGGRSGDAPVTDCYVLSIAPPPMTLLHTAALWLVTTTTRKRFLKERDDAARAGREATFDCGWALKRLVMQEYHAVLSELPHWRCIDPQKDNIRCLAQRRTHVGDDG